MSFFSTFSDINKNGKSFKQQEQRNADEQEKRKKYFGKHKPSEKELKESDEFRRVVINSVNLMDAESENKAESTELAFEQANGFVTLLGMGGAFAVATNRFRALNKKFNKLTRDGKINEKLDGLTKTNPEILKDLEKNRLVERYKGKYTEFIFEKNAIYKKEKWENLGKPAKEFLEKTISKDLMKTNKQLIRAGVGIVAAPLITSFVVSSINRFVGTVMQIKASRIARYQARQELKDPMNFVEYTDEQKAEAKKNIDTSKISDKDKNKDSALKDIKSLLKDAKEYEKESKKLDDVTLSDIPEKDVNKAYGRQKIINKAIRKINNDAENYSENIETVAGVIVGSSFLGGLLFGKLAGSLTKGTEAKMEKRIKEGMKKGGEHARKAAQDQKILKGLQKNKGSLAGLLATLIALPFAMRFQKDAARAGRFQAKKDLEKDPNSFINVPKEELDKINAKGKVKKDGFLDAIKSVPSSLKIMKEYKNYKKTTLKEEKALNEELKKTKVSDKQLEDAKSLQMRVFKSFDTVDDHSQEYSEDMEAACEIGREAVGLVVPLAGIGIPIALLAKPHKVAKPLTGFVAGVFKKLNKFTNKYADGLSTNLTKKIDKRIERSSAYRNLKPYESDINSYVKEANEIKAQEMFENLSGKIKNDYMFYGDESDKTLSKIQMIKEGGAKDLDIAEKHIKSLIDKDEIKKYLNNKNDDELAKMYDDFFHSFDLDGAEFHKLKKDKNIKIKENLISIIDNIPQEKLLKVVEDQKAYLAKNPTKMVALEDAGIDKLKAKDILLTKELAPIAYAIGGTFIAGSIGLAYTIENWLTNLQKKAGRLGVESAIKELDKENEKFKAKNQNKQPSVESSNKTKAINYFDLIKKS